MITITLDASERELVLKSLWISACNAISNAEHNVIAELLMKIEQAPEVIEVPKLVDVGGPLFWQDPGAGL